MNIKNFLTHEITNTHFLEGLGISKPNTVTEDTMRLLTKVLQCTVYLPWGSGVMKEFEYDSQRHER